MEASGCWVGLDIGSQVTSICGVDDAGSVVLERTVGTQGSSVLSVLDEIGTSGVRLIAVEAGTGVHLVRALRAAGYPVSIFEAFAASRVLAIRRNKTDRNDARGLADIGRLGRQAVPEVRLKSLAGQRIRSQLAIRDMLIRQRIAIEGSLRAIFDQHGGTFGSIRSDDGFTRAIERELVKIDKEVVLSVKEDIAPLVEVGSAIRNLLTVINKRLKSFATSDHHCRNLMSIPGIGPVCAVSFYSAIEDPLRFAKASAVAAYLGLTPAIHESGKLSLRRGITRRGNSMTRAHLVMAARVILGRSHSETAIRRWGLDLARRIGHRRAEVAVARKLAVIMLSMWRNDRAFEPSGVTTAAR